MIFFFGKPVAEPSANASQARRTMARSNLELQIARSPLLRYGLAPLSVSVALGGSLLLERFHFRDVADPLFLFTIAIAANLVAVACNHPNCLVLPFRLELIRLAA
jgi:hypothetical protein